MITSDVGLILSIPIVSDSKEPGILADDHSVEERAIPVIPFADGVLELVLDIAHNVSKEFGTSRGGTRTLEVSEEGIGENPIGVALRRERFPSLLTGTAGS